MKPEDRHTRTVEGAAAYEAWRAGSYGRNYEYDIGYDDDPRADLIEDYLNKLVNRHYIDMLDNGLDPDKDDLREQLYAEAEELADDYISDYCGCNDYHCPCH
jgi:hypothetical protein